MPVISGQSSSPSRVVFCLVIWRILLIAWGEEFFSQYCLRKIFLSKFPISPSHCPFHWYFKVIGTCFLAFGLMALVSCLVVPHMEAACINELIHKYFWCVWPFCLKNKKLKNGRNFITLPPVFPRNEVWETNTEITHWWLCWNQFPTQLWPIRNNQIWVVTRHQYGISALISQTLFRRETSGGVGKCRLFSQAL